MYDETKWGPSSPDQRDILQVCRRGHLVTNNFIENEWARRKFCTQCRAPTLIACERCQTPLLGALRDFATQRYLVFEVPAGCAECGAEFPWTRAQAVTEFCDAFTELSKLVMDEYSYSIQRIIDSLGSMTERSVHAELTKRSQLLASYCWSVRATLRVADPKTVAEMEPFVMSANNVVLGLNSLIEAAVELLGVVTDRTLRPGPEYQLLRDHLERSATRYELAVRGVQGSFEVRRPPVLADIPVRRRPDGSGTVYPAGSGFEFYADLSDIASQAKREVVVLDGYADGELFELFLRKVPTSVPIRILTSSPKSTFKVVGRKFAAGRAGAVACRINPQLHDRSLFVDDDCYVIGHSLKNAGVEKPTYVLPFKTGALAWRQASENLWSTGTDFVF